MEQQFKTDSEIYAVLEREIIDLTLRPGCSLSENPLCTRFGAPRSLIRVVLQRLQENGLELLKAPEATAGEIADIISAPCPPIIPAHCDGVSCRACWLSWLTGEPIKEKEPPDKRTAPDDAPAYYHPPVKAIREAAERIREGRMEYAAEALTRRSDSEEPRRP